MMKKEKQIYCNLCQLSFNNNNFVNHISENHLPKIVSLCNHCNTEFSSALDLENHLNKHHKSEKNFYHKIQPFPDLYCDPSDVILHIDGNEWIRKSFSTGSDKILSKKEIRSILKTSCCNDITSRSERTDKKCSCSNTVSSTLYNCYFCNKHFSQLCLLKSHVINMHLQLPPNLKKILNLCDICGTKFPNEKSLFQHKYRIHKDSEDSEKRQKTEKTVPFCHFCGKSLANKSNLKRHVLNQHSEEIGAPPNNNVFTCDYCKCFFSNKSSVKRHIENLHLKMKDTRKSISCYQCEQRFNSIKNLNAHLTIEHEVAIHEEKLQFSNLNEFWEWKQEEGIRTNSRFIQLRGLRRQRRKGEEISTLKFVCNRSGIFHSKSNGKRAYRIKGSSKIGRYCSAYIEIMFKENSSVNGTYCSTHSGHDNDLRYLTLTMDEKREIYEKIKSGATFSAILNEIRNSVGKELKRKHLVTNKDLHNIVTTFKKLSKTSQPNEEILLPQSNVNDTLNDQSLERSDRHFNNDLDICADLWVETCQRMINRFDQNQSRTEIKDNETKNIAAKNVYIDEVRLHDTSRSKLKLNLASDFSKNTAFMNSNYAVDSLPGNTQSYKQQNYLVYSQEPEPRMNSDLYFGNVSRTVSNKSEIKDFCGMSTISCDLRVKDYYPVESIVDNRMNEIKMPVCSNFNSLDNTSTESTDSAYLRTLPNIENADPFSYNLTDKVSMTNSQPAVYINSEESLDHFEGSLISNDIISSDTDPLIENNEKKRGNEASDLRDRVNSVTALYNIVESELDERKKNIIRNYVDNMFRVLQYRYNKCKNKKKNSEKRIPTEKKPKKRIPEKKKQNKKLKEPSQPKPVTQFSCPSYSKITDSYVNVPTSSGISMRPDLSYTKWDQY